MVSNIKSSIIALALIFLVLIIAFRSVRYGLISIIPNLLPTAIGFGAWYLIDGKLSMGQMTVLVIAIGIVVDDTVHFLSKYQRARQEQQASAEKAVRSAFHSVGPALWTRLMKDNETKQLQE